MRSPLLYVPTLVLAAAVAGAAPQDRTPREPDHHLVQVIVRDAATLDALLALDLDLAACSALELPARQVDVIATDADIARLQAAGLDFEVAIRNLEDHHAKELAGFGRGIAAGLTPPLGQGGMGGHYTLAEIEAILDSFARDYPALCSAKTSIGRSHEGRDIWMVKISDNVGVDENEPEVLYDGVHHAREMLSVETILLFMDELLSGYATDPEARRIVDERELFFVPVLNPDGHEYNRGIRPNGGGMWRKNRRDNGGGVYGVDLNRNWTTGWNAPNGGNSTNPSSDTYRGPAPMSEPEIQALDAFIQNRQFVQGFSCHTYTDVLLRPWGYQVGDPPNAADYDAIGNAATARNGLQHGDAASLLYIAAGTALDHYHTAHGMYGWTPEMGRSDEGGFWPNPTNTVLIARRHQHMLRTIALTSGPALAVGVVQVTEGPGSNNNGVVEPGETGLVSAVIRNDGAAPLPGAVQAALTTTTSGIVITNGSASLPALGPFRTASNSASPFAFTVPAGFSGVVADFTVAAVSGSLLAQVTLRVPLKPLRVAVDDDFEADRGFAGNPAATATTGLFERSAPSQTTSGAQVIQPGADHSPSGTLCWVTDGRAGSSAGTYDVDNGWTEVTSPVLDLAHMPAVRLSLWRWYAESVGDDSFEIWVSNDAGGTWAPLLDDATSTNAWVAESYDVEIPITALMQFRFRAKDLNASLVEALIDDLEVAGPVADGALTLLGSGRLGSRVRIGLNGRTGAVAVPMVSGGTGDLTLPGIGRLLLDPSGLLFLPPVPFGAGGYAGFDVAVPNDSGLRGRSLYWQQVHVDGAALGLGNRQSVTFR